MLRTALIFIPTLCVALTWWAATKVRESRALRQGDLVALLSETAMPPLNPFLPATEADRQLVEVIHSPLIKVGASGRIEPALASEWRLLKRVTVWFTNTSEALQAKARLIELRGEAWKAWKLDNVELEDSAMRLTFADPMFGAVRDVLRAAKARVQFVTILRIEAPRRARDARTALVSRPELAASVQRVWFDGDDAFEIAVAGGGEDYARDLGDHLRRVFPENANVEVMVQAKQTTLEEPVIEFVIDEHATWHDGRRVNARDVKATFDALGTVRWKLPEAEGLRVARTIDVLAPNRLHVVLWRHRGPALCAWLGLPILPESWLKNHPFDAGGHVFAESLAPGAGPCAVEHRDYRSLVVYPADKSKASNLRRLTLVTNLTGFSTQLGYSTNSLDFFWPSGGTAPPKLRGEELLTRPSPPRESVRLLFNLRAPPLDDARVREALALAVDRSSLISQSLHNRAAPLGGLFAPNLWLSSNPAAALHPDFTAADHLLSEAGWLRGIDGMMTRPAGKLVLKMLVPANDPELLTIAADLRMQWKKAGAETALMLLDPVQIDRALAARSFEIVLQRKPLVATWDWWSQWHSDEPGNVCGVSNRQIDLLLEALSHEFDPDEAAIRCKQLETLVLAEHAVVPLLSFNERALLRASIAGQTTENDTWTLRELLVK